MTVESFPLKSSFLVFIILALILPTTSYADSARYIYDDLGRLRIVGNASGEYATYEYDEVGNLLSISTGVTSSDPPVVDSINPDVFIIGSTTPVIITGHNLLMTQHVTVDNPFVSVRILKTTDTEIEADITVQSQASEGPVTVTVTTFYGSAEVPADLTSSRLSFSPGLLALMAGSSGNISTVIYPPLSKSVDIRLKSSNTSIASVPETVTIPSGGSASITVNALSEGVAYISSGTLRASVYVTAESFSPGPGESVTANTSPLSVYIDSPFGESSVKSSAVSAYIELPIEASHIASRAVSTYFEPPLDERSAVAMPLSVKMVEQITDSSIASSPVSAYIEPPSSGDVVSAAALVSVYIEIDFETGAVEFARPVGVYIESPSPDAKVVSGLVSVKISSE